MQAQPTQGSTQVCDTPFLTFLNLSVLDFHVANLEYGNAATLDKVSLKNWDQVRSET